MSDVLIGAILAGLIAISTGVASRLKRGETSPNKKLGMMGFTLGALTLFGVLFLARSVRSG